MQQETKQESQNVIEHIKHLRELNFSVVAKPDSHHVDFYIYNIEGWAEDKPLWHKAGAQTHPDPVESLEESEVYLHGSVKWDGCSNWYFDEQDQVMLHGCSREDLTRFGEVMAFCWDWTSELLPSFSHN